MRLFGVICYAIALYYGYTAVETMQTGIAYPMRGDTNVAHRKDDSASNFSKYLLARWMFAGGFVALGVVMQVFAGRFEQLERDAKK